MQASPGTGLCPLPGSGLEPEGLKAAFVERGAVAQETRARGQQRKAGSGLPAQLSWLCGVGWDSSRAAWSQVHTVLWDLKRVSNPSQPQTSGLQLYAM